MEASKELVGELLINPEGVPVQKYDLEELVTVLEKCKYMSSPSIKNDVTAFRYIRRFGIMDGIATLRGCSHWAYVQETSSRVRAQTQRRCLYSRCPRWGPDPGCTWSIECNPEEIWNTRGSCSITSSVSRIGPPWLATSTTPLIVES
jgi:hypothetical protein